MIKYNNTYKSFGSVSNLIIKELRKQLKLQEYYATGKLSRSFSGVQSKGKNLILDITSSKHYWTVVNDPRVAFSVNKQNIKGLDRRFAEAIYKRLKKGIYANRRANRREDYVYWKHGNTLQRSNFAGIVAKENSKKIAIELAPAIGNDVAEMIRKQINNNTKAKAS